MTERDAEIITAALAAGLEPRVVVDREQDILGTGVLRCTVEFHAPGPATKADYDSIIAQCEEAIRKAIATQELPTGLAR